MGTIKSMVVGSNGFIGKNLKLHLENRGHRVIEITRQSKETDIMVWLSMVDNIYFVAGVNRPTYAWEYGQHLTFVERFCEIYNVVESKANLVYASSTHVFKETQYGENKRAVEDLFRQNIPENKLRIERFTNVFGKYCRPNYNNFVSTFIHNVINGKVSETTFDMVSLIYIDDLVRVMLDNEKHVMWKGIVSDVYCMIEAIHNGDRNLDSRFKKQLHATYCSQLENLKTPLDFYSDERGAFCTLYENPDQTMISINVVEAGQSKGGHWHHTKIEEFTCIHGMLEIEFTDVLTGEKSTEIMIPFHKVTIPPGKHHVIKNTGKGKALFVIWTNEKFNKENADTWKY